MRKHSCYDVGVVNLFASALELSAQCYQRISHDGTVFQNFKVAEESIGVFDHIIARDLNFPRLWTCHNRKVFAHNLAAG